MMKEKVVDIVPCDEGTSSKIHIFFEMPWSMFVAINNLSPLDMLCFIIIVIIDTF